MSGPSQADWAMAGEYFRRQQDAQPHYGAIAYSPSTRRFGWSFNCPDQANAEAQARSQIGVADAITLGWGSNSYLALALAEDGSYGYGWDESAFGAADRAMNACTGKNPQLVALVDTIRGMVPRPGTDLNRKKALQREDTPVARRWGIGGGIIAALAVGAAALLADVWTRSVTSNMLPIFQALESLGVLLCILCGALAARKTGRVWTGVRAAQYVATFWSLALALAILAGAGDLQRLAHGISALLVLADVVTTVVFVIIGILVGMALGALGGLVGRRFHR